LIAWLTKRGRTARVVLEATGTYSLDIALALHRAARVEVMVVNPRAVKLFAGALMQRAKTDLTAAVALRE
jgi:transposase